MFDLEQAFLKWRGEMATHRIVKAEVLEELENHLREDMDQHLRAGLTPEKAFALAVEGLGSPENLRQEFEVVGETCDAPARFRRIMLLERDIMLPIKAVVILMLVYSFSTKHWFGVVSTTEDLVVQFAQRASWVYVALSLVAAILLLASRRLSLSWLRGVVFTSSIADGLFLSLLCVVTGGYESALYWVFLALIVRNTISLPRTSSVLLNIGAISCYTFAGHFDRSLVPSLTPTESTVLELYSVSTGNEQVFLRLLVLVLVAICCFLIESIVSRQRFRPRPA